MPPAPVSPGNDQLLSLEELGLLEVEPGVVEDSFENRRVLRRGGYQWVQATGLGAEKAEDEGRPVRLLRVLSVAEREREAEARRERKAELLVNPGDPDSDYLPPYELLWDAPMPFWVRTVGWAWKRDLDKGLDPEEKGKWLPVRCTARKADGRRCWLWAGASRGGADMRRCQAHMFAEGGAARFREDYVSGAKNKIVEASLSAADKLEALLDADSEVVQLKAASEILDRAGVKGGMDVSGEITVTHVNASDAVREKLQGLRDARIQRVALEAAQAAGAEVVDAEVVEEGHDTVRA